MLGDFVRKQFQSLFFFFFSFLPLLLSSYSVFHCKEKVEEKTKIGKLILKPEQRRRRNLNEEVNRYLNNIAVIAYLWCLSS